VLNLGGGGWKWREGEGLAGVFKSTLIKRKDTIDPSRRVS
jgi:hypothetical protein